MSKVEIQIIAAGSFKNKVLVVMTDKLREMLTDYKQKNPTANLPKIQFEDLVQMSYKDDIKSQISFSHDYQRAIVSLTPYDFTDAKTNKRMQGAYFQLCAVLPQKTSSN